MNNEPAPEEFDKLRKLLALKRSEQPPPGYFDRMSNQILARIEAGEAEKARPWYERWLTRRLSHPAVGWVYACMAMALVLGGVTLANRYHNTTQANAVGEPGLTAKPAPGGLQLSPANMIVAETNTSSQPPAFLLQPGSTISTQFQGTPVPVGYSQP